MPTRPTNQQIEEKVVADVAVAGTLKLSTVKLTSVLAQLGIDHQGFVFLASSLRAYIHLFKPKAKLRVDAVEKDGLTVEKLRDFVIARIDS